MYTVKEISSMAGITPRTLRHYDSIGLLVPSRRGTGEYRVYSGADVDRLQEILLYRELGIELADIQKMIDGPKFNREKRLRIHLDQLIKRRADIEILINNVKNTIESEKGDKKMKDDKKFEGLKKEMIHKNEKEFGYEIREKWGDETIDESNRKMMKLTKQDFEDMKHMANEINDRLTKAVQAGLPSDSEEAIEIAKFHKKWLKYSWPDYTTEAHIGVTEMYVADERFRKFYDAEIEGCAAFLKEAVANMVKCDIIS